MSVKSHINSYYSAAVVGRIVEKYGIAPMDALNSYLHSETLRMFLDPELAMLEFYPEGIFDLWESEQVTGDPRNSLYIRRDEYV